MRLLIVSNRLPVTVIRKEGRLTFQESVGGLVSGLSAYLDSLRSSSFAEAEYLWVGWPGATVDGAERAQLKSRALGEFHAYPVFLSERAMDKFYLGFCNRTLWPLFHYFPSYTGYDEDAWIQYKQVNRVFCDSIAEVVRPDDVVWIHDYHLMLLPKLLRERFPDNPIGFFLHIPFPSFEIYRLLPSKWRREILDGLLGADLIGFHTRDYTQHFLRCVQRLTGHEHNMGNIAVAGRLVQAGTFPMGIDFQRYYDSANSSECRNARDELRKTLTESKIILSIDRLDYTKGIGNRLRSYEVFLGKNPEWRGKVTLFLVVVPSRVGVEHYQQTRRLIDELVGRINGRFGSISWTPIRYQFKFLPLNELTALYSTSDVALVTPLRDGMNLVAKEFVAARTDQTGVLVLSEMAGAARELGEALIINPNDIEEIADALKQALEMPIAEQIWRNQTMQARLRRYDVVRWADDFVHELLFLKSEQEVCNAKYLTLEVRRQLVKDFARAQRRVLLLDYDGTLSPFVERPENARPTTELLRILGRLAGDQRNQAVIVSGRDKSTLQEWFGEIGIGLVAEHGAWLREKGTDWRMTKPLTNEWKSKIRPILETCTDRLPRSFIEEKEFSLVWHYRAADPELGAQQAKELMDDMVYFTANIGLQILQGSKVVEVRQSGIDKGNAALQWISNGGADFTLAAGDDWTDEDLFQVLPSTAYSIKIGLSPSHARFNLRRPDEMVELLRELAASENHSKEAELGLDGSLCSGMDPGGLGPNELGAGT